MGALASTGSRMRAGAACIAVTEAQPLVPAVAPDHRAPLVSIESVTKTFGAGVATFRALHDVSLAIEANEFFTLLGPSGCGKTTLLRLLAGFEQPTAGTILLDGRPVMNDPPNRRPVNTVFQSYALFPHLTVAENVAFGLERQGLRGRAVADRVQAMLTLVRLDAVPHRRPQQLSGGQQQRVALARALAPQPRLLLLDEPMSALDLKLRRGMQVELKRIQRETGITFVLVTHDQEEALSMSDRIGVMEAGHLLQVGSPADIYERPNCRFVADFIGEANVLPGATVGLASRFAAIRPERVEVGRRAAAGLAVSGTVLDVTYMGATTRVVVRLDDGTVLKAARGDLPLGLEPGQAVCCTLPAEFLLRLDA